MADTTSQDTGTGRHVSDGSHRGRITSWWFIVPLLGWSAPLFGALLAGLGYLLSGSNISGVLLSVGGVLILLFIPLALAAIPAYYVEAKRIGTADVGWDPSFSKFLYLHFFTSGVGAMLGYSILRWRRVGLTKTIQN